MHHNYYFLKKLAPRLDIELRGKSLLETFSQEKDELVLVFAGAESEVFYIKATLKSDFACLSFPEKFDRARRNSVNLFTELEGAIVAHVRVFENERAFGVFFENGYCLVFKMFGNRSNLVAFDLEGNITSIFNNKLLADHELKIDLLDRHIDQSYEAYIAAGENYRLLFPTFNKLINSILVSRLGENANPEEKWDVIQQLLSELEAGKYFVVVEDHIPILSLLNFGENPAVFNDPIESLNAFYFARIRLNGIVKEKGEVIRIIKKRIDQTTHYLDNTFDKLVALESAVKNDEIGHIIMANLNQIPARATEVELYDFYRDTNIRIKLKKDLSPQKNAEGYYRKSKNEKIELYRLNDSLSFRENEKKEYILHLSNIEAIESLRELRAYIKKFELLGSTTKANLPDELFKTLHFQGYTILIGRNAKNNDLLTKQFAFKEDLWLHARDVSGSHVVIKHQAGKKFPSPVIERAAEVAAFYSKRKNDSLCPVIVTPKKYVRKLKNMPEGAVIVDKEEVIMVVPRGE